MAHVYVARAVLPLICAAARVYPRHGLGGRKATDYDRWIRGMRKLQARLV